VGGRKGGREGGREGGRYLLLEPVSDGAEESRGSLLGPGVGKEGVDQGDLREGGREGGGGGKNRPGAR